MPLTRDVLEAKLEGLRAVERQQFANYNAALGARQFCEHLIKEIETKEAEAKAQKPSKK